jgi:undecaprenyl-diphosphatase
VISYFQAIVIGLLQGVTELVPISSLGHSVLLPDWLGWHTLVRAQSRPESFYLAFVVALHVATALALLVHYRATWGRVIRGFFRSLRTRRVADADERLAWLIITATIPVGVAGLVFEHQLRVLFARPSASAVFLMVNGVLLYLAERLRRRAAKTSRPSLDDMTLAQAGAVGAAQCGALLSGISRSGATMGGGLLFGLDHEDAAQFAFLLATPVILAAGLYKLPDLTGPLGDGVRAQALAGSIAAFVAAWVAVRFLERFFRTRTLTPFAVYCVGAGALSLVHVLA